MRHSSFFALLITSQNAHCHDPPEYVVAAATTTGLWGFTSTATIGGSGWPQIRHSTYSEGWQQREHCHLVAERCKPFSGLPVVPEEEFNWSGLGLGLKQSSQ